MGTSKSYDGPSDTTPLLPDWAQGEQDADDNAPEMPDDDAPPTNDNPPDNPADAPPLPENGESPPTDIPVPEPSAPPELPPNLGSWRGAKSAMRRFAATGERTYLRNAGRNYVRAQGGSSRAAASSTAGRAAASRVVGFLSGVANRGLRETFRALGLEGILGQPLENVLAAIVNLLAPDGANLDEVAVRRTVDAAIMTVFERYGVEEGGIEQLNKLDAAGVAEAFEVSVSEYVFQKWMLALEKRIEENALSAREACRLEREAKAYIREATKLDLQGRDVLQTDWALPENQRIIDRIFEEVYHFLEVA